MKYVIQKAKNGFTLIELLVVIAIISLLSSVVVTSLNTARVKSRDSQRIANIRELMKALELHYDEHDRYPISAGGCGASTPDSNWCNSIQSLSSNGRWIRDGGVLDPLEPFIPIEPQDPLQVATPNWTPQNGGTIYYFANDGGGTGHWYMLVFGLEDTAHPLQDKDGAQNCSGTTYHYGNGSNGIITLGPGCAL